MAITEQPLLTDLSFPEIFSLSTFFTVPKNDHMWEKSNTSGTGNDLDNQLLKHLQTAFCGDRDP